MAKGIACAQEAARQGKIVTFCIGLGEALDKDSSGIGLDEARKGIESLEAVDDRLNYVVAMFLVIAEQYSYFLPYGGTWGVDGKHVNRTWMHIFPMLERDWVDPKAPQQKMTLFIHVSLNTALFGWI